MGHTWLAIGSFLAVFTLAIVSPGPNFILVVNRALADSAGAAIWTALGVAIGSAVYGLCGLLGWIVLLDSQPSLRTLLHWVGGLYLAYLGGQMLLRCWKTRQQIKASSDVATRSSWQLVMSGLLTNLSNPKAWAFYLSLFTVVLTPGLPLWSKVFLNTAIFLISFGWYSLMALLVAHGRLGGGFHWFGRLVQACLGLLLLVLGMRLLSG